MEPLAFTMTFRASATPEDTAESCTSSAPTAWARRCASVVFPVPAGPHRTMEGRCPDSTRAERAFPGSRRCCCPTTSSNERGRIRAASGSAIAPRIRGPFGRPGRTLAHRLEAERDFYEFLDWDPAKEGNLSPIEGDVHRAEWAVLPSLVPGHYPCRMAGDRRCVSRVPAVRHPGVSLYGIHTGRPQGEREDQPRLRTGSVADRNLAVHPPRLRMVIPESGRQVVWNVDGVE